jgi:hypothetical protein
MASVESPFVKTNMPRLLDKYRISYFREDDCIEYFITEKDSGEQISYALVLSLDRKSREIHVSRFYPELYKQKGARYLSAVCFYLLVHHFGDCYHVTPDYTISLDTRPVTYERFFSRLKDFHFQLKGLKLCQTAQILSDYDPLPVDTSMIKKRVVESPQIPFLVEDLIE